MILVLQVTVIIFSFIMIYFALLHYKRGELNKLEFYSWTIIWMGTMVIVAFPDVLRKYSQTFAVSRLFDLMILGGFILVITMVSISYIKTRRMEQKFEEFIRREALKDVKKK